MKSFLTEVNSQYCTSETIVLLISLFNGLSDVVQHFMPMIMIPL